MSDWWIPTDEPLMDALLKKLEVISAESELHTIAELEEVLVSIKRALEGKIRLEPVAVRLKLFYPIPGDVVARVFDMPEPEYRSLWERTVAHL
jgi:hypothetical protein